MTTNSYRNKIINADCRDYLDKLSPNSIDLFLSDIPYGINLDRWDVLHNNTNSALLGASPAQNGKSGFKKRGKPINGWNEADKKIGQEYQAWCMTWTKKLFPIMKEGSSLFIFGARRTIHRAILAMEDSGFLLRDTLVWKKQNAHHRAQKISIVLERRGLREEAEKWEGWRLGNLAPMFEPIAWFFKPYKITITDNLLENQLGAMNLGGTNKYVSDQNNILDFWFDINEKKYHEAQKPLSITKYLIELTTIKGQTVLDPFVGSGTTALASKMLGRNYIGFEIDKGYAEIAKGRLKGQISSGNKEKKGKKQNRLFNK